MSDADSSVPLLVSLQREIDAMLAVTEREAAEIRDRARRDTSEHVARERAALASAEQEAFDCELAAADRQLTNVAADGAAALAALRDRLDRLLADAAGVVVDAVTGL